MIENTFHKPCSKILLRLSCWRKRMSLQDRMAKVVGLTYFHIVISQCFPKAFANSHPRPPCNLYAFRFFHHTRVFNRVTQTLIKCSQKLILHYAYSRPFDLSFFFNHDAFERKKIEIKVLIKKICFLHIFTFIGRNYQQKLRNKTYIKFLSLDIIQSHNNVFEELCKHVFYCFP